eukprot:6184468-Pleurochrysis_carterae.AAC.3
MLRSELAPSCSRTDEDLGFQAANLLVARFKIRPFRSFAQEAGMGSFDCIASCVVLEMLLTYPHTSVSECDATFNAMLCRHEL